MHARSVPLERVSRAIGGWFTGVCVGLFGSILVAWAVNAWHEYRWGVSVGLLTIAIVFWGLVLGVFVGGPVVAVLAVRRAGRPTPGGYGEAAATPVAGVGRRPKRRSVRLLLALSLVAAVVVAGGIGVCGGLRWAPCSGFPPHETIAHGDFRYVLPSPDGSRYAFISAFGDAAQIGILYQGATTDLPTQDPRIVPVAIDWMPDSTRLAEVFHSPASDTRYRIGIFSLASGLVETSFELPFNASDTDPIAVSPDGASVLVTSAPRTGSGRIGYGTDLFRADLRSGRVEKIDAAFTGYLTDLMYVDASHAVVLDSFNGHSRLSLVDLGSALTTALTPSDLNVYEMAGRAANGGIVFSAFHGTSDPLVTTGEDFDDPVVALVEIDSGEVRELFEPGVTSRLRMEPDGVDAVAIAETCSGDCSGTDVWRLDLSRYLA
jgi:hypothetical protein